MNGSQKDFAYAGESQQNRLEQAQKSERNMLFAFFLFIVGVLVLIGFGFIVRKSKELDPFYCVMPSFLAALLFFGSGGENNISKGPASDRIGHSRKKSVFGRNNDQCGLFDTSEAQWLNRNC